MRTAGARIAQQAIAPPSGISFLRPGISIIYMEWISEMWELGPRVGRGVTPTVQQDTAPDFGPRLRPSDCWSLDLRQTVYTLMQSDNFIFMSNVDC